MKDVQNNQKVVIAFFRRYHLVIFAVLIVVILSVAVLLLYNIVEKAGGADANPPNSSMSNFDQATIERIEQLKTSDQPSTPLNVSQRRISPFNE